MINFFLEKGPGKGIKVHDVIMNLTSKLKQGHVIYMDNYYTSLKTALSLLDNNILCCGTVRANRGVPEDTFVDPKTNEQGKYKFKMAIVDENKSVIVGHWIDSGIVRYLSTAHNGEISEVKRRKSGHTERVTVEAPLPMRGYNQFMHGNDRADQKRRSYSIQLKSNNWWKSVFNWIFDSSVINAHLLYRQLFSGRLDQKEFAICFCKWLCGFHDSEKDEQNEDFSGSNAMENIQNTQSSQQLMEGNHILQRASDLKGSSSIFLNVNKRGKCLGCQVNDQVKRAEFYCIGCKEHFHLDCYFRHHHPSKISEFKFSSSNE